MSADDENRFRPKPGRIRSDAPKLGKTKSFLTQAKKLARQHSNAHPKYAPRLGSRSASKSAAKGGKAPRTPGGPGVRRGRGAAFVRARTLSGGWRHSAPGMRRVVVKTRYVQQAGKNGKATAHLRYIQRDGTSLQSGQLSPAGQICRRSRRLRPTRQVTLQLRELNSPADLSLSATAEYVGRNQRLHLKWPNRERHPVSFTALRPPLVLGGRYFSARSESKNCSNCPRLCQPDFTEVVAPLQTPMSFNAMLGSANRTGSITLPSTTSLRP